MAEELVQVLDLDPSADSSASRWLPAPGSERSGGQARRYGVLGSQAAGRVEGMDLAGPMDDVRARTFQALLDRPALDRAYRTARLILLDPAEAEDATHDAALSAWRRFGDLRDQARFDAWFGRILVNSCRDHLRRRKRLVVSIDELVVQPVDRRPGSDPTEGAAERDLLRGAFRTLSPEHREVIALRFYADLTVDEIAQRTGARPGTVKSRLHHALRYLRTSLEESDQRRPAR